MKRGKIENQSRRRKVSSRREIANPSQRFLFEGIEIFCPPFSRVLEHPFLPFNRERTKFSLLNRLEYRRINLSNGALKGSPPLCYFPI